MPRPPRLSSSPASSYRVAIALASALLCALPSGARASWTYQPRICPFGDCAAAEPSLVPWQRDVRALQALWRDCGTAFMEYVLGGMNSIWSDVFTFDGDLDAWIALCPAKSEGAEIGCVDGRVRHLAPTPAYLPLACRNDRDVAPELADLTEVTRIDMSGVFARSNLDVNLVAEHLLELPNLLDLDLSRNKLTGELDRGCDGCASRPRVRTLHLDNNDLTGVDLSGWGVADLEELYLGNNRLSGPLPDNWSSSLKNLKVLSAAQNAELEGSVLPASWFASDGMIALENIDMTGCKLAGSLPAGAGNLGELSLRTIMLGANNFEGDAPPNLLIAHPERLEHVDLSGNHLTGPIPAAHAGLMWLTHLDVSDNKMTGSPPLFTNAPLLSRYDVSENSLDGTVPDMCGAPGITGLYLNDNKLTGALPDMSCLTTLTELDASVNKLTSLTGDWLGSIHRLQKVNVADNQLTGEPPAVLCGQLMKTLNLGKNMLRGSIPESVGNCAMLEVLNLSFDPSALGDGSFDDAPAGTMPTADAMSKLTKLTSLALSGLGLQGELPASIFALQNLRELDLSHNALTGVVAEVPPGSLVELRKINLAGNKIAGAVPLSLLTLPKLTSVDVSDNALTSIEEPNVLADVDLATIVSINLADNNLVVFPTVLRRASGLKILDLTRNSIAGEVPQWLCQSSALQMLLLGSNALSGGLHEWLTSTAAKLNELTTLTLDNNPGVHGPGADWPGLERLESLRNIRIANAGSFGDFPVPLPLPNLHTFHAPNAGLTGTLPGDMFDTAPALQRLDLSGNLLAGAIPSSVSTHAVLTHLFLSDNAFDGTFPALPATVLARADATDGTSVNFTDAGSFRCPLPENRSAYATAMCACGPGFAGPDGGRFACVACEPGTFAAEGGASVCEVCDAGSFSNHTGSTGCEPCAPGEFQALLGRAACEKCPQGKASAGAGATSCVACDAGSYAPDEGLEQCEVCAAGAYQEKPGKASCDVCPAGTFSNATAAAAASTCEPCPPGTHAGGVMSSECAPCPTGAYAPDAGSVECATCPTGSSPADAATRCECDPGHVISSGDSAPSSSSPPSSASGSSASSASSAIACEPCPPGTRARTRLVALELARVCERCPNGTIAGDSGSDECDLCELGTTSDASNTRCVAVLDPTAASSSPAASSANATDEYKDLLASYVAAAKDGARTPVTAVGFFVLLGAVAACCGCFTGWYRRRRARLRQLALERELLVEEAESDMARGRPPRRATIYALAGVDAEAAELDDDVAGDAVALMRRTRTRSHHSRLDVANLALRRGDRRGDRRGSRKPLGTGRSSSALYKAARRASGLLQAPRPRSPRRRGGYDRVGGDFTDDDGFTDDGDGFEDDLEDPDEEFEFDESDEDGEKGRRRGKGRPRRLPANPPPPDSKKPSSSWWKKVTNSGSKGNARMKDKGRRPSLPYHPTDDIASIAEVVVEEHDRGRK